ncbi:Lipase/lipooxygenase [Forsythia ovata]|uniref:Lipase/lipooxygenase n=1 Tax=Forsythia ovata TaxID=205694 RepID=A0ABD1U9H2_9LAMI
MQDDPDCVYTVYIKTGSIFGAGTDSIISLTLNDSNGNEFKINNLETWGGLMGPDYNYFESGNLDIFSGRGPCLNGPVCAMNLTSDGSGFLSDWYVSFVEVTVAEDHEQCAKKKFIVQQWLETNTLPYKFTAIRN